MRREFIFPLAVSFLMAVACGGGGSGAGGGTGLSEGPIEAFGSIWVNGVEWETDGAVITRDGEPISEDDLRLGMFVRVKGDRDDGPSGRASDVELDDELKGPIESIDEISADEKRLVVLSFGVTVHRNSTVFFGTSFDALRVDDVVEVHGYRDADNAILASFVEFEDLLRYGDTEVEFRGTVSDHLGDTFRIGEINVTYDPSGTATELELDGPLTNGRFVEVEGILQAARDVDATEIEDEAEFDDDDRDEVEVEGFVRDFNGIDDFVVGRFHVNATDAEFEPGPGAIGNGVLVEVEGSVRDGILFAREVEVEDEHGHDDGSDDSSGPGDGSDDS